MSCRPRCARPAVFTFAVFAFLGSARARPAANPGTPSVPDAPQINIRQFAKVDSHLYRGRHPTPDGIRELARAHVTLVLDLRESGAATQAEKALVEQLGMKYVNVPLPPVSAPPIQQLRRALNLVESDPHQLVFVHCWRGKDRTGTVVACYRIEHDRWTPRQALREADRHGMSYLQHSMREFILRFEPGAGSLPALLPHPLPPTP